MKDYYGILEISQDANMQEIKKAYRKLAIKYHPDKLGKSYSSKFMEISEAYKALSDPEKRKKYDNTIKPNEKPKTYKYRSGTDIRIYIKADTNEIAHGKTRQVITTRKGLCKNCSGTGSAKSILKICKSCGGSGLSGYHLLKGSIKPCTSCGGRGKIPEGAKCSNCSGTGLIRETFKTKINFIPQHLLSKCVVIEGAGNRCPGAPSGDLIVNLEVAYDKDFKMSGLDVEKIIEITPAQAIIGDTISVIVFGKSQKVEIPPFTQSGHVVQNDGGGMSNQNNKGDLIVRFKIRTPQDISEEERILYKRILTLEKFHVSK